MLHVTTLIFLIILNREPAFHVAPDPTNNEADLAGRKDTDRRAEALEGETFHRTDLCRLLSARLKPGSCALPYLPPLLLGSLSVCAALPLASEVGFGQQAPNRRWFSTQSPYPFSL